MARLLWCSNIAAWAVWGCALLVSWRAPLVSSYMVATRGFAASRHYFCQGSSSNEAGLVEAMVASTAACEKLSVEPLFAAFAKDQVFLDTIWQKRPFLCEARLANLVGAFTMDNVQQAVDSDFLEAGRGTVLDTGGGWNMASVSQPRGSSFEEAKLRYEDVCVAMKKTAGTVVFNSAGGFIPPLAAVCLETVAAFDLPAALNMYLTDPGQKLSAPPHTDRQEVFVLQTQGQKRWRVFSPPSVAGSPRADPFARGKGKDALPLASLGAPLLDTVMQPGQVLYIPAGFPHTTDTLEGVSSTEPSVHLTVGLDSHVWGLSFAGLRSYALRRSGQESELNLAQVDNAAYWAMQEALPLGFLSEEIVAEQRGFGSGMRAALQAETIARLLQRMRRLEPTRWAALSDAQLAAQIGADEAATRLLAHHRTVTEILRNMYNDVAFRVSPAQRDLSFFRSQPYFRQLEAAMEDLERWAGVRKVEQGPKKGFGGAAAASPPPSAATGKKKGFG